MFNLSEPSAGATVVSVAPDIHEPLIAPRHGSQNRGPRRISALRLLAMLVAFGFSWEAIAQRPDPSTSSPTDRLLAPSPFATVVFAYEPGEGQFVNDPQFNDPVRALGAPVGGGTLAADNSKLVTLGGFGGSITLGFDRTIWDHPLNPLGLDAIVFGNAVWVGGNPNLKWAEAGVIEISLDVNRNGLPDDPWYLIPGSDIPIPEDQRVGDWFLLPDDPYANPPIYNPNGDGTEAYWGYAEMTPVLLLGDLDGDNVIDEPMIRPQQFYTVPDDPWDVGLTPGCGGGDAFDIAWAVLPETNELAHLPGFDFIRITTGPDGSNGTFGEVSVELGGVAAVRPWR